MAAVKETPQERMARMTQCEREYWRAGVMLGGMDEAGRGPLAGPVYAACVWLPETPLLEQIDDSKKLTPKRREGLYEKIVELGIYGVGVADQTEIDEINILQASKLAFLRAYDAMPDKPAALLTDAIQLDLPVPLTPLIHGDQRSYLIAAASIIAKVERDRLMRTLHEQYPVYGFDRHKGYPTPAHYAALEAYGPCPAHRLSFLRKKKPGPQTAKAVGVSGEARAKAYLQAIGYTVLEQNYRIRGGEIDLIAQDGDCVVFVEVKARRGDGYGSGGEAVDRKKRAKITRVAEAYLQRHALANRPARFDVIEIQFAADKLFHYRSAFRSGE